MSGASSHGRAAPNGEAVVYAVLTVVGVAVAVMAVGYGVLVQGNRIGPGFLPLVAGALLAVLGATLTVRTVRQPGDAAAKADGEDTDVLGRTRRQRTRILWTVFALLTATVLLVLLLGFIVSFGLLVLTVSLWVERRRLLPSLAVSAGACTFVYVVFVWFMQIPLPTGVFGS